MISFEVKNEDDVWSLIPPENLWLTDKLLLSRHLGYECAPTGVDVQYPGWYISRPCVNALGLGLGAKKVWLDHDTSFLSLGFFWCEWFEGKHYSVDWWPEYKTKAYTCQGIKDKETLIKWKKWVRVPNNSEQWYPESLHHILKRYKQVNIEYIGNKIIEIHLRPNEDFQDSNIQEFIPVWVGEDTTPPKGYRYIHSPEYNGRIGAFIK